MSAAAFSPFAVSRTAITTCRAFPRQYPGGLEPEAAVGAGDDRHLARLVGNISFDPAIVVCHFDASPVPNGLVSATRSDFKMIF